jgi:hypothetical protein
VPGKKPIKKKKTKVRAVPGKGGNNCHRKQNPSKKKKTKVRAVPRKGDNNYHRKQNP